MSNRELFSGEEEKNAGSKEYSQVSSPESIASTSSGFFDRGKKTRSQSLDEYNTRVIPKSSRSDRLALEQQIKEQRDKYQEDSFSAGMQLDGDRYNHNSTNSRRSASVSLQSPSINGRGFRYRRFQGSYSDPRATASQSHSQNANIMGARLFEERDALVNSIQGIFGESERRVTTIEELEDLMLMEVSIFVNFFSIILTYIICTNIIGY